MCVFEGKDLCVTKYMCVLVGRYENCTQNSKFSEMYDYINIGVKGVILVTDVVQCVPLKANGWWGVMYVPEGHGLYISLIGVWAVSRHARYVKSALRRWGCCCLVE
jgi:hypothetical protein